MKFIKPTIDDLEQILQLWKLEYEHHHNLDSSYYIEPTADSLGMFREYLIKAIQKGKPNILIAKQDDEIIGFMTFDINSESYPDTRIKKFGEVLELFVDESQRGKGIGKKFIEEAEEFFKNKGIKYMKFQASSFNLPAFNLYKKMGYINRQTLFYKDL